MLFLKVGKIKTFMEEPNDILKNLNRRRIIARKHFYSVFKFFLIPGNNSIRKYQIYGLKIIKETEIKFYFL